MRQLFLALVASTVILAGCGDSSGDDGHAQATTTTGVSVNELEGRSFVTSSVQGRELAPGTAVALSFAEHRVSATAGCSTQNGDVSVVGGRLQIISSLARTDALMDCGQARRVQDRWLATFLTSGPAITLEDSRLTLVTDDVTLVLEDRS